MVASSCSADMFSPDGAALLLGDFCHVQRDEQPSPTHFHIWHCHAAATHAACFPRLPLGTAAYLKAQLWSPDSDQVLCIFSSGHCVFYGWSGELRGSQRIAGQPESGAWGGDGTVAVLASAAVRLYTVQDGLKLVLAHVLGPSLFAASCFLCQPAFSLDGAHLACLTRQRSSTKKLSLVLYAVTGRLLGAFCLQLDEFHEHAISCIWSSDGSRLAVIHTCEPGAELLHVLRIRAASG